MHMHLSDPSALQVACALDLQLRREDVQELNSADALAAWFARLGYDTNARTEQSAANLGITAESTLRPIRRIELIADQEGFFQVYLFELTSVTVAHTRALARSFRNRAGNYLLVLTSDYERLDFVLLQKYLPAQTGEGNPLAPRQVAVRPRTLTVERRNPSRVDLRVLRRFTWTESDPFAQYEKLLSAYAIADWSEEHFNNRALFSDHYLRERLPEMPEWRDDPKPAYLRLRELYTGASARLAGKKEEVLRTELLEPALEALGFHSVPGKRSGSAAAEPDYRLFSPADSTAPLALCLAYPWGRFLDGKDDLRDTETPDENPGAVVVSLLEKGEAPWVIVTNGKLWRLYAQRAHSRATNYYEIDLEELLAQTGPQAGDVAEAFRYFWLLFRREALTPVSTEREGKTLELSLLDRLLLESEDYAKELGERLKERVFEEIFPHLAAGFITDIRRRDGAEADLSPEALDAVFQGTLTFLYRLLFLLYAESRGLLPVREARGYYQASLTKLKQEVAEAGGKIVDEAEERLGRQYDEDEYALYARLQQLFRVIDRGDAALNVPLYNGGLFLSEPAADDDSPEAEAARFLNATRVPDRFLARALDLLSRDEDPKSHDLVFIDYKSLGVRQLGSIYEGLLEFKVRVATEKMAVVKGKRTEEIVPYREAVREGLRILTDGRGQNAPERVQEKGSVYLENDKRERKATGSYYTPDHIVKYIVEHAVGPVLEQKFEAMRPRLRQAQKQRRAFFQRQEEFRRRRMKAEPDSKAELIGQEMVGELFDVKVLDPAMGSGHFLVEAVDFITDRALDFLNAFPWNPIRAELARTRESILQEMDEQGISIDAARLTDVNLLKRHVLKRCIYGVDLNPMAVELAKVSLWLDCFTLGAPLSFLDHHLRCGNSLIGVTVAEVQEALDERQSELLGSRFAGLLSATEFMRRVGELSDVTGEQVRQSRAEYRHASDALLPFKRILDIYTSQWFGNGAASKGGETSALALLQNRQVDAVLNARNSEEIEAALAKLPPSQQIGRKKLVGERDVARTALTAARQKSFFHWELEFPEVFFATRSGTERTIERREGAGFDAVIGNPPYINVKRGIEETTKRFLETRYALASGQWDEGALFYEVALGSSALRGIAASRSSIGLIVPKPFFLSESYLDLRELLLSAGEIVYGPCGECFADAGVEASIGIVQKTPGRTLRIVDGRDRTQFSNIAHVSSDLVGKVPFKMFTYMLPEAVLNSLYSSRLASHLVPLNTVVRWTRGVEAGKRDAAVLSEPGAGAFPLIAGEAVQPFQATPTAWIRVNPNDEQKFKPAELYTASRKLLLRRVAATLIAAVDETQAYVLNTIYVGQPLQVSDLYALAALLNSSITRGLFRGIFNLDDTLFPYIRISQLDRFPIPLAALNDAELSKLGRDLTTAAAEEVKQDLLEQLDQRVCRIYELSPGLAESLRELGRSQE
jgi:hypothetical protein